MFCQNYRFTFQKSLNRTITGNSQEGYAQHASSTVVETFIKHWHLFSDVELKLSIIRDTGERKVYYQSVFSWYFSEVLIVGWIINNLNWNGYLRTGYEVENIRILT